MTTRKSLFLVFALVCGLGMALVLGLRTEEVRANNELEMRIIHPEEVLAGDDLLFEFVISNSETLTKNVSFSAHRSKKLSPIIRMWSGWPSRHFIYCGWTSTEEDVVFVCPSFDIYPMEIVTISLEMMTIGLPGEISIVAEVGDGVMTVTEEISATIVPLEQLWVGYEDAGLYPRMTVTGSVLAYPHDVWITVNDSIPVAFVAGEYLRPSITNFSFVTEGWVNEIQYPYQQIPLVWDEEYCFRAYGGTYELGPDYGLMFDEVCITPEKQKKVRVLQDWPKKGWTLLAAGPAVGMERVEMFVLCEEKYTKVDLSFASSYPIPPGPFCRYAFVDIKIDEIEIVGEGRDLGLTQVADATILFEWSKIFLPMVDNH